MKTPAILLLIASNGFAACSGSGITWTCTTGTTLAQIASTLSSASDGATLTFDTGNYTWSGSSVSFSNTKAATLICATVGGCDVTSGNSILGMLGTCSGTSTKLYRISGFNFSGGGNVIWFYASTSCTLNNIRIDHNTFSGQTADSRVLMFGDNSNNSYFYGVIDNNTFSNSSTIMVAEFYASNGSTAPAGTRGTADNMFFEDNDVLINTQTNAGAGCMDSTGSPSVVWRNNLTQNCLLTAHGTTGGGGIVNFEIYNNYFKMTSGGDTNYRDCERCFHHQGSGEVTVFQNTFEPAAGAGKDSGAIEVTHYRSAPPATAGYSGERCDGNSSQDGNRSGQLGYPCKRQPGRDVNFVLHPMYTWLNKWFDDTASNLTMTISNPWSVTNPSVADHVAINRDYYSAVSANAQTSSTSPFNGTTGMGFGTIANRPTTCTATPQSADAGNGGVGYWATDEGEWDSTHAGADGRLYRCSATNTWTLDYTPYTYPHPLRNEAGGSPATSSISGGSIRLGGSVVVR